jgi:hypothetical protein
LEDHGATPGGRVDRAAVEVHQEVPAPRGIHGLSGTQAEQPGSSRPAGMRAGHRDSQQVRGHRWRENTGASGGGDDGSLARQLPDRDPLYLASCVDEDKKLRQREPIGLPVATPDAWGQRPGGVDKSGQAGGSLTA